MVSSADAAIAADEANKVHAPRHRKRLAVSTGRIIDVLQDPEEGKNKARDAKILVDMKNIGLETEFKILAEHVLG
jgi:hypothetical protein